MRDKWQVASGKWVIPLLLLVGYGVLPFWFPLIPSYREGLADVSTFAPSLLAGLGYGGLLLLLFWLCWLAGKKHDLWSLRMILGVSAILALPLLLVYPINANDLFRYFLRGQLVAQYGQSPYLVPPSALPDHEYTHLAGEWANAVSPYGPVWEGIDALVVWVTQGNLLAALFLFKGIGLLSVLGVGWMIAALSDAKRKSNAILWLWNPAVLYMFVIDAHNDGVVLFWVLLGAWVWKKHNLSVVATIIMLLAPLTKLSGIVPLPFLGLAILRTLPDLQARLRYLFLSLLGAVMTVSAVFLPFGSPLDLVQRLLMESQGGGGFSPLAFVYFVGQRVDGININIGDWVAWGTPLFVVISGLLLLGVWFGRDVWRSSAESYYAYLFTAFKFRIWYALWLFPFALISGSEPHRRIAYLFLIASQLNVILYAHLRQHLFWGDHAVTHLIVVPLTFLLPLLLPILVKSRQITPSKPT